MVMDGYYVQDRLQALWQKIETLHLSYLQMEDSPQKLDQRTKLEDCIKEYLCLAPHNLKFCFPETAQVLHRSASCKKDFSGYKAATGWNAIQMYAGNLLAQPWRKEYRQINMFCGFYIHNIEANLVGAEIMFEVMGYKHEGDSVLALDGPICPDRVANVSRDALMAYVECQILKAIWEEVSSSFPISWLDVLEFRETHFCNPKQSINALNYRFHQKHYQEQTRSNSYTAPTDPISRQHHHSLPMPSNNRSFPPITPHPHVPGQCVYGTNGCYPNNYATYAPVASHYAAYPVPLSYQQAALKPAHYAANGYCCNNAYPGYACPVPTGQLVELGPQGYDTVDATRSQRQPRGSLQNVIINNIESDKEEGPFENWDYVYRNLESQGYSKDLGERGDILSALEMERSRQKKVKATNLDEAMNNLVVSDRPLKINEALEKYKETDRDRRKEEATAKKHLNTTPTSSYENLSHTKSKGATKQKASSSSSKDKSKSGKVDVRKAKTNLEVGAKPPPADSGVLKWQCGHCTFLNEECRDICEMCSKSKVIVDQQMEIGGSQCPKCTLVNPRDMTNCQACNESLKDSPTYI